MVSITKNSTYFLLISYSILSQKESNFHFPSTIQNIYGFQFLYLVLCNVWPKNATIVEFFAWYKSVHWSYLQQFEPNLVVLNIGYSFLYSIAFIKNLVISDACGTSLIDHLILACIYSPEQSGDVIIYPSRERLEFVIQVLFSLLIFPYHLAKKK